MKNIDFLPRSFHQARRRRYLIRRNTLYSIGLAVALASLHFINDYHIQSASAALADLHAGDQQRSLREHRRQALETRKRVLQDRLELISRLEDDAPLDAVIAEITRHMSDAMAIRSLVAETTAADADAEAADPLMDRGPTRVVLGAVAPNDMQVGIFFGRLAESALFDDVTMSFSREMQDSPRHMREFELVFTLKRVAMTR